MTAPTFLLRCTAATCGRTIAVKAESAPDAHYVAAEQGWEFRWGGNAAGWAPRCPRHPHFRFLFEDQARRNAQEAVR